MQFNRTVCQAFKTAYPGVCVLGGGGGGGRGRSPFELCSHTLIHLSIKAIFSFNKGKVFSSSYFILFQLFPLIPLGTK